jgi:hypothetical protein
VTLYVVSTMSAGISHALRVEAPSERLASMLYGGYLGHHAQELANGQLWNPMITIREARVPVPGVSRGDMLVPYFCGKLSCGPQHRHECGEQLREEADSYFGAGSYWCVLYPEHGLDGWPHTDRNGHEWPVAERTVTA